MAKGKTQWKYFNGLFLAWGLSIENWNEWAHSSFVLRTSSLHMTHHVLPRSSSDQPRLLIETQERGRGRAWNALNRQHSQDSLFLLRGRMNHVTLLLELLGTNSSSSCLQGGTREPSSTDVLLSLVTSARRDEPTAPMTNSFNFLWVHWRLQIPTEKHQTG